MDLLLAPLVLAALVVVGDVMLRRVAGAVAAGRLAGHLGAEPSVTIHGWGSGWRIVTGCLPRVSVTAARVPAGDLELAELAVHLRDVELPRDGRPLRAASGRFRARLAADDLAAVMELPVPATLQLVDGGVRLTAPGGLAAEADLAPDGAAVLVEPRSRVLRLLPHRLRIDLGDLPAGARVERLRVTEAGVIASGPIDGDALLG